MNPTPPKVEGVYEDVPRICMDPDVHYAQPRWYYKLIQSRPLSDAAITRYMRQGRYARGQFKAPGGAPLGRLVWSA
jgi:hypothetical protein